MACCLTAPSHYLNQCRPILTQYGISLLVERDLMWPSFTANFRDREYFGTNQLTWNEYFQLFKDNKLPFGNWFERVSSWWERREKLSIMFIKYEDMTKVNTLNDDVIKWKYFPRYWPFVQGIHRSPVNSPHKGQWRRALMFSVPEETAGWTIEMPMIWEAIVLIMTSL